MGALVGLVLGIGLLLIWQACTSPPRPPATPRESGTRRLLDGAGLAGTSVAGFLGVTTMVAAFAFVVVQLISGTVPVALVFAVMAGYLPRALVTGRAGRRAREFAEVWPEAVDNLASAVRAGLSLPEALGQLGVRGPEPLRPAFVAFATDYQVSGRFGECLDRLKARLADPVGDRVVEGLRIAREVGGGELGTLLRNLSRFLRDDARTRSELESRQAWTVNSVHHFSPCTRKVHPQEELLRTYRERAKDLASWTSSAPTDLWSNDRSPGSPAETAVCPTAAWPRTTPAAGPGNWPEPAKGGLEPVERLSD